MKPFFRFGARKEELAPAAAPAPAEGSDAWSMLRGPTPTPAIDVAPPVPADGEARQSARRATYGTLRPVAGGAVPYAGPNRTRDWTDIDSLEDLGRLAHPHRLRLHAPMLSAPPAALFEAKSLPERIVTAHGGRELAAGAALYAVPGHELGGFGLLQQDGRVWTNDEVLPAYLNDAAGPERLALPDIWTRALLTPDAEILEADVPVGIVLHPNMVYGHFLLEMLPRLLLLARLRAFGRPVPVAVPSDGPDWMRAFVALLFDAGETILYDSQRQRLRAPCFILPTPMNRDYHFHPEMNLAVEELLAHVVGPTLPVPRPPSRIYLSRRRFGGWHGIDNEEEVEQALTDVGFAVVHPHEMPLPAQLALYAGAECIVANYGSAAHNALFAPRGAGVFCIDWLNRCQSGIAALRGQKLAFMAPEGVGFHDPTRHRAGEDLRPTVDCAKLVRRVAAFLDFVRQT